MENKSNRDIHRGRYNEPAKHTLYHGNYEPTGDDDDIYGIREKARKHMQMIKNKKRE